MCGNKHSRSVRHHFAHHLTTRSDWQLVLRHLWMDINAVELAGCELVFMGYMLLNHSGFISASVGRQIRNPLLAQEARCKHTFLFQKSCRFMHMLMCMKIPAFFLMGWVSKRVPEGKALPYHYLPVHTSLFVIWHKDLWKLSFPLIFNSQNTSTIRVPTKNKENDIETITILQMELTKTDLILAEFCWEV